jgi:deoxyribodipyrimidine photolyase
VPRHPITAIACSVRSLHRAWGAACRVQAAHRSAPRAAAFHPPPPAPRRRPAAAAAGKDFPDAAAWLDADPDLDLDPDEMSGQAGAKRKADAAPDPPAPSAKKAPAVPALTVNPQRVRELKGGPVAAGGPVLYWMSRDQRVADNWALLHACQVAARSGAPVAVAFNLVPEYMGAGARQFGFMLRGLQEVAPRLAALGIPFFLLRGDPVATVPQLAAACGAALVVADYGPLRLGRAWRAGVAAALSVPLHEVDAHNVVPVWAASDKREYAARTIRPKIHAKLPAFMREFPAVPQQAAPWPGPAPPPVDWAALLREVTERGAAVPEVGWIRPGEAAAAAALADFLTKTRLSRYADKRNDPAVPDALSGLSPYLHFGQLAPQRAAIEAARAKAVHKASVDSFLEELVVRRELAGERRGGAPRAGRRGRAADVWWGGSRAASRRKREKHGWLALLRIPTGLLVPPTRPLPRLASADNYCHYVPHYDSLEAAYDWARDTLRVHAADKREFVYTRAQFEAAGTHDKLWNAAQLEMVHTGKMHGFMRMYWAKKILEWSASPEEALEVRQRQTWARAGGQEGRRAGARGGSCRCRRAAPRARPNPAVAQTRPADQHLPERPLPAGRPRPQRLRGVHVVDRGHPRSGVGRAARVRQDPVHEPGGLQAQV